MNNLMMSTAKQSKMTRRVARKVLATLFTSFVCFSANSEPYQRPLFLGGGNVAGNLALVASLEFPTMVSVAHIKTNNTYDSTTNTYIGYFDPKKCYRYSYSETESERHFYPVNTSGPSCSGLWSGNYLNWATMQTIDPFRKALTGGYRARDTTTETWLEKAKQDGQGSMTNFPNRAISSSKITGATPFGWGNFRTRILGLGNKMYFTNTGNLGDKIDPTASTAVSPTPIVYDGSALNSTATTMGKIYEVSVRVKVCDPSVGVESNCVPYGSYWKPEGLIQEEAKNIRYSGFGYLGDGQKYGAGTDAIKTRGGGVMRARMKFVGPTITVDGVEVPNPNREWNPSTGVFIQDPDSADASATASSTGQSVAHSGVISFLNLTGQIVTDSLYKRYDPVSELYYAGIRYFKNLGNVPEYSAISGTDDKKRQLVDGLPVITNWGDPIQNWCQKNVILGIGDTNTQWDKNIYGGTSNSLGEPVMPASVSADTSVNVATATNKVAALEGITISNTSFSGSNNNSAFIAGLAYDSKTKDIRPDAGPNGLPGKQTISTYWVDIQEFQTLKAKAQNQYWLAAKYGGLDVPNDFNTYSFAGPVPLAWWHTNSDTLSTGDLRPDNFYTVANPDQMVLGLQQAFAKIASELNSGSASAVAADSTRIEGGTKIFQAKLDGSDWSGQLIAYTINPDGSFTINPDGSLGNIAWETDDILGDGVAGKFENRRIYTIRGTSGVAFDWSNLSSTQQAALIGADGATMGLARLNWLKGEASSEGAPLRSRNKIDGQGRTVRKLLGDIVHSDPVFVGPPKTARMPETSPGFGGYNTFITSKSTRRNMLYVGANDGMLHAFDADTGDEQFAYIPNAVFPKLKSLTDPNYVHHYFVDGSSTVGDAYVGSKWRSILVGTLGAGGRAVFALDVTDPDASDSNDAAEIVRWEYTDADLGYTIGQMSPKPVIGCLPTSETSCKWVAVFGNGYQSRIDLTDPENPVDNSRAYLYVVDLADGGNPIKIAAGSETANGLSAPVLLLNDQQTIQAAYAGDLQGNLWKFDLANNSSQKLFTTPRIEEDQVDQPITAAPNVALHPVSGYMVYFGTGQYYLAGDHTSATPVQSLYGIWDKENTSLASATLNDLQVQTIIGQQTKEGNKWRLVSNNEISWEAKRGWYLNLIAAGERVTDSPILNLGRAIFTTRVPNETDDPCDSSTGTSWLMAVDMETGGRTSSVTFDANRDRDFNESDYITVGGQTGAASGFETGAAGMSRVTIGQSERGIDLIASGVSGVTTTASSVNVDRDVAIAKNAAIAAIIAAANAAAAAGGDASSIVAAIIAAANTIIAKAATAASAHAVDSATAAAAAAAVAAATSGDTSGAAASAAQAIAAAKAAATSAADGSSASASAAAAAAAAAAAVAADAVAKVSVPGAVTPGLSGTPPTLPTFGGGPTLMPVCTSTDCNRGATMSESITRSWLQLQ